MALYAAPMGYSSRKPADFPMIDRAAVMRDAHQIARKSRDLFASYRAALAYGLWAAWKSAKVRRDFQSLNRQVQAPQGGYTAAQIAASRRATRSCGSSLSAS